MKLVRAENLSSFFIKANLKEGRSSFIFEGRTMVFDTARSENNLRADAAVAIFAQASNFSADWLK